MNLAIKSRLRLLALIAWIGASLALVGGLVVSVGLSKNDLFGLLQDMPVWILLLVTALTFLNQVFGAWKWRLAAGVLAQKPSQTDLWRMTEITTIGTFFSQFVPTPVSMVATRWVLTGKSDRAEGLVVRSTVYDQFFDVLILLIAGMAGLAIFLTGIRPEAGLAIAMIVWLVSLAGVKVMLRAVDKLIVWLAGIFPTSQKLHTARLTLVAAAGAPARIVFLQSGLSFLRLSCLIARACLISLAFAPGIDLSVLIIMTPAIVLVTLLPITPGGLGLAEWSWSFFFISLGLTAVDAARIAIAFRIFIFLELMLIIGGLLLRQTMLSRRS